MATQGTTTIDFGSASTDTRVAVSAAAIASGQLVEAWVFPAATASNTIDNHWVEGLTVVAGNVQAGVGFTIYARVEQGLGHGVYNVGYVYN